MSRGQLKRTFDIAASAAGIILSAPVVIPCAAIMAAVNRSSPLFVQERIGLNGKPFNIYKIKSMKDAFDTAGNPLPDNMRMTRIGGLLRKTRLDELPQLFNVLKGDMSLVGPRPLGKKREISTDPARLVVRPGLTGLSQINGTNKLGLDEVLAYDKAYIARHQSLPPLRSLFYDIGIIAKTPHSLLQHRDAPAFRAH